MEKFKSNPLVKTLGFNRIILVGVLIALYLLFSLFSGRVLGSVDIMNVLNSVDFMGFLTIGVMFVIATGGIDFSIGPVMYCAALVAGQLLVVGGLPLGLCLLISILVGLTFGVMNGIMVAYMKLPSFISSMASMRIAQGIGSLATKSAGVSWPSTGSANDWYRRLINYNGIPTGLIILLTVAIICSIILNRSRIGRYILCIGSNREAVRLSGVDTRKWEALAYIICGTLAGIAAILYVGVNTKVTTAGGDAFNNNAIAACVMGGTSMAGGVASVSGGLIGILIIALLRVGINAMKFSPDWQYIITGIIVALAVYADIRSSQRRR
ncbi:MAG: ABC transporter permease [Oscillospiraceae bacterium]|jgi:ribose transport system permease protein|nr:ABC transporter permease [Oscillospiraceae bacterium]MBO7422480.1 ABC transporter permease [Oscillospiraceae bacterium]MBO7728588.1 ABC transporter permease [Oscillospiraceae bacterium]MBP5170041.1 ABC transporter permease [Oscillospiraceae bacterium]MBQ1402713.1 ABC transporter permease [Oscillospiraceae bacterium]